MTDWQAQAEAEAEVSWSYRAENERLRYLLDGFLDAAQVDATMAGPKLRGWNRSQLDRAYQAARDAGL